MPPLVEESAMDQEADAFEQDERRQSRGVEVGVAVMTWYFAML
jgi:hypothetical protein